MRTPYLFLVMLGLASPCVHAQQPAHPLDDVFKKADKATSKTERQINSSIAADMEKGHAELKAKVDVGDRKAAERNAALPSPTSGSALPNSAAPWKLVKQYEGGFADFGFAANHTIHLVRCRNGAEHKLYRDGKGKWGSIGLGGNNSAPSFEMAASLKCS